MGVFPLTRDTPEQDKTIPKNRLAVEMGGEEGEKMQTRWYRKEIGNNRTTSVVTSLRLEGKRFNLTLL